MGHSPYFGATFLGGPPSGRLAGRFPPGRLLHPGGRCGGGRPNAIDSTLQVPDFAASRGFVYRQAVGHSPVHEHRLSLSVFSRCPREWNWLTGIAFPRRFPDRRGKGNDPKMGKVTRSCRNGAKPRPERSRPSYSGGHSALSTSTTPTVLWPVDLVCSFASFSALARPFSFFGWHCPHQPPPGWVVQKALYRNAKSDIFK